MFYGVGGDAVVLGGEGDRHALLRLDVVVLCFVFVISEQDVGKVVRAAGDVNGLQGVDKRRVETLDIFAI